MMNVKIPAIVVAVLLLLAAVGAWPEDYEALVRWAVVGAALFTAYTAYEKNKQGWFWCMVFAAILFNPVSPACFDWRMWRVIDVLGAVAFFMASKLP